MLQLVGSLDLLLAFKHAHVLTVVQNADNLLVLRLHDADVLQHLVHRRLTKGNTSRLGLQHQRHVGLVLRQIPAVRLVRHAREPQLIERRELTDTCTHRVTVSKSEDVTRQIAYCILRQILCHLTVHLLKMLLNPLVDDCGNRRLTLHSHHLECLLVTHGER